MVAAVVGVREKERMRVYKRLRRDPLIDTSIAASEWTKLSAGVERKAPAERKPKIFLFHYKVHVHTAP